MREIEREWKKSRSEREWINKNEKSDSDWALVKERKSEWEGR